MAFNERFVSSGPKTADAIVATGAGMLGTITISCNDAAPTAGSILVYDGVSAAGKVLYAETFTTTAFRGYSVTLNVGFNNGIYIDFTTTADVNVFFSYAQ